MANFQDSTVPDLTATGVFNGGTVNKPLPPAAAVSKTDGTNAYTTLGAIPYNVTHFAVGGMTVTDNGTRINIPEDGIYLMYMRGIGSNTADTSQIQFTINGANTFTRIFGRAVENVYPCTFAAQIFSLTAGDYVGGELLSGTVYFSSSLYCTLGIVKIG